MTKNKKREIFTYLGVFLIVFSILVLKKKFILYKYVITQGKLINYSFHESHDGDNRTLIYEYWYKGERYRSSVDPKTDRYDYCENNLTSCYGTKFWVIHSYYIPNLSLIDVSVEIERWMKDPKPPDDFSNFK